MQMMESKTVLVIYEDETTRNAAVQFCDSLVNRFWARCDFALEWCSFEALTDARAGRAALLKATDADIVIFASHPFGPLPIHVELWIEGWADRRGQRQGALIGLLDPEREGCEQTSRYTWMRTMAHKAGMDYLTTAPLEVGGTMPCLDACAKRADARTNILEGILARPHIPVNRGGGQ